MESTDVEKEVRTACFDTQLNIEAYKFEGIMQKFPNHFHEHYVIGFIEKGKRFLSCKNNEYILGEGDLILLNPRDNHMCEQIDYRSLDFRCINIPIETMKKTVFEINGQEEYMPEFTKHVLYRSELVSSLKELHTMIIQKFNDFKKEEIFFYIVEQLINEYTQPNTMLPRITLTTEVQTVCKFLENNYARNISLNELSLITGISKYHLLRSFTKQKGISPYSFLETIRIDKAKHMLEEGTSPIEVALQTGFNDQSHFTNFFKKFIGLTPKQYMKIFSERP